jgi:hypothetical protein
MERTQPGLPDRLARANPTRAFLVALALVLAGLFLPGIFGAVLLLLLAGALGALLVTTWPVQPRHTRIVRLVILTLLVTAAVFKIL